MSHSWSRVLVAIGILTAIPAGCRAVLVGWGYGHATLPAWLDPLRIAAPAQLLEALQATRSSSEPLLNS